MRVISPKNKSRRLLGVISENKFYENIATMKLLAKKEVGQNFLIDASVCHRIVEELCPEDGSILEIGCGPGSLTYALSSLPNEIDAIDIDEGMLAKAVADFEELPNVHPKYGNAAEYDYSAYSYIVGNLPYYITSLILERVLLGAKKCKRMVFMVQKEAEMRILSKPGTKEYGPLCILLALSGQAKHLFKVSRQCFVPVPHVESSVFLVEVNLEANKDDVAEAYRLACKLFLTRRKTIWNGLKSLVSDETKGRELLQETGLSPSLRPEELTPEQYLRLAIAYKRVK